MDNQPFGCTPLNWSSSPARDSGYESSLLQTPPQSQCHRPEKLKRRWLREALNNEHALATSPVDANKLRPTVLMMATKSPVDKFVPVDASTPAKGNALTRALQNAECAIALMELAASDQY